MTNLWKDELEKLVSTDMVVLVKKIIEAKPDITPEEMLHNLHISGYGVDRAVVPVYVIYKLSAEDMCRLAIREYRQPIVLKENLKEALVSLGLQEGDVVAGIEKYYPDTMRYSIVIDSKHQIISQVNSAYNVGTGEFTVEAWIKPSFEGGTIIARKATEGGFGNGGFLLVLKPDGEIKFATDDGMGFYEINSIPCFIYDGKYHHVMGVRCNGTLKIYFDFEEVESTVRTNRFPNLNINNYLGITIGWAEQIQEPYNCFHGNIGECRIWSIAKNYKDKTEWENTDYVSKDLIAMWGFWEKKGTDYSWVNNDVEVAGSVFEKWE